MQADAQQTTLIIGERVLTAFPFPLTVSELAYRSGTMTDLDQNRVYQSNKLIEASYSLTLNEKRLVLYAASLMDSKKAAPADGHVNVTVEDFANVFGMDLSKRGDVYNTLKEAVERLYERDITRYVYEHGKEPEKQTMRWIYYKNYKDGEGRLVIGFSPTVLPYLTLLEREFTGFKLKNISALTSFNSFRIYELTVQYLKFGSRTFDLAKLRELLQMETKYPNVKDFRRYVLDSSVAEVNQRTDLELEYEPIRKGRAISGFKFSIKKNAQIPLAV
jgi:plasmid replication initiation protein